MKQSKVPVEDHFLSLHTETIDPPVLSVLCFSLGSLSQFWYLGQLSATYVSVRGSIQPPYKLQCFHMKNFNEFEVPKFFLLCVLCFQG